MCWCALVGVHGCAWVCSGMRGCVRVCASVHKCAWVGVEVSASVCVGCTPVGISEKLHFPTCSSDWDLELAFFSFY